jgi:GDPmannose 4,6-dehydratase
MANQRRALITGVSGQTGSYLAELLLAKDYKVFGLIRRHSTGELENLWKVIGNPNLVLLEGDMTDQTSIDQAVLNSNPSEIYNLAAQSFVGASWTQPMVTQDITFLGFVRLLEAVRRSRAELDYQPAIYQASSSEMYGNQPAPLTVQTQMTPRSPYGVAKLAAHRMAQVYRESFGMLICCGICFNHESPRRGPEFVTRKIARGVARRKLRPFSDKIPLGNVKAYRDWGYAPDYALAMWKMLQWAMENDQGRDFVIATGETHSVQEFLEAACEIAQLPGSCYDHVTHEEHLFRPAEINKLVGDPSEAALLLDWTPSVSFWRLVEIMVEAELEKLQ